MFGESTQSNSPFFCSSSLNNRGTGFLGFGACPVNTVGDPDTVNLRDQGWGKGGRPCWLYLFPWPFVAIWNDHKKWTVHMSQMGFGGFLPWDQACSCIRFLDVIMVQWEIGKVFFRSGTCCEGSLSQTALVRSLSWKEASKNAQGRRKVFKAGLSGKARLASGLLVKGWCQVPTTVIWGEDHVFPQFPPINVTSREVFFLDECKFLQQRSTTTYYRLLLNHYSLISLDNLQKKKQEAPESW